MTTKYYVTKEYDCGECEGEGIITRRVELREALEDLGVWTWGTEAA